MFKPSGRELFILSLYFTSSCGYFSFLSTLVIMCNMASVNAEKTALIAGSFFLVSNIAKIFVGNYIDNMGIKNSSLLGCSLCCTGLLIVNLYHFNPFIFLIISVIIYGFGTSICGIANKQFTAVLSDSSLNRREVIFSKVVVAINLSSAISSPISIWILHTFGIYSSVTFVFFFYLISLIIVLLFYPDKNKKTIAIDRITLSFFSSFVSFIKTDCIPGALLINSFFWFIYAQLFSVLAIHIGVTGGSPSQYAFILSLNAIIIILLQMPVTKALGSIRGTSYKLALPVSFAMFSMAFLFMLKESTPGPFIFIILFSFGEILFSPFFDSVYLRVIKDTPRGFAYSCLALSTASGEILGSSFGVFIYDKFNTLSLSYLYWSIVFSLAIVFSLFSFTYVNKHTL